MQLSSILQATFVMALGLSNVALACNGKEQDCCWKDVNGCLNQHWPIRNDDTCVTQKYLDQMCNKFGVSCGADCCSISTGKGRACPNS
ncbi:hypothetical protein ABOM_005030 [Aspergillus bombycis]|uniref:Extracellular membrane protein CFEM domain-containing protein n=1 Tax=Aspergillus bombycis TaxID=109264 RepID=A0A1F8A542_9EURO|nr:hypothetical protein ABOM_005030 [Aspergillus bombycis]OGM46860.1 hypothetical protein ABOM_005030 [Aspergillus bombycis]